MPVHNSEVADTFNKVADLLEIKGANNFRVRAYRNAARAVGGLSKSVSDMVEEGEDLTELSGLGKDLAGKVEEIVKTGKLSMLEELKKEVPAELADILKIGGLGAKRAKVLYDKLDIKSIEQLEKAARDHRIRELDGFGKKTEENILDEVGRISQSGGRVRISVADETTGPLIDYLKNSDGVEDVVAAGSYRRRKETVGDLDILATCRKGSKIMDDFVKYEDVDRVVSKGKTKSTVLMRSGFQVDLRVVQEVSYGAALHYFTGSKAHNIAVRKIGVKKGLKINEYGVFKGKKRVAGKTEEEVYKKVNLAYIEPELREDVGEIEAARKGKLPRLIELDDIRGDLHSHTKLTDGKDTLEAMAGAARERGYDYLANTEHTKHVTVAKGLDAKALRKHLEEIDKLNDTLKGIRVLKSAEVDILEDGSLDLPDEVLKELDLTVCAVHYKFNLSRNKQTGRIIKAMDNPYFNIFDHPTGRLINERAAYDINMEKVMQAAKERGCFLELNAAPERLDLNDADCRMAKDMGVKVAISTDAHRTPDLDYMRFGIWQARRGWLEKDDVLNTRKWGELKRLLKR